MPTRLPGQVGYAKADAAPSGTTKLAECRPSHIGGLLLFISIIDAGTVQTNREIDYRVHAGAPFTLRVGQHSEELGIAHSRGGVDCSAHMSISPERSVYRSRMVAA